MKKIKSNIKFKNKDFFLIYIEEFKSKNNTLPHLRYKNIVVILFLYESFFDDNLKEYITKVLLPFYLRKSKINKEKIIILEQLKQKTNQQIKEILIKNISKY